MCGRCRLQPATRRAIGGPGGHSGTAHCLRDRLYTCAAGSSAKSLPNPEKPYAVIWLYDGLIRRAWKYPKLGS